MVSRYRLTVLKAFVFSVALIGAISASVDAVAQIPYGNVGTPNPTVYTFTAMATGDVIAYFAGSSASFDEQVGLLDNGVLTSAGFVLDDHTSSVGQSFDLGHVTAGDTLTFVDQVEGQVNGVGYTADVYSNPSLNVAYDSLDGGAGVANHNHIYSTSYTTGGVLDHSIPSGTYVAFEDLPFPNSDYNYFDDTFVFTNVGTTTSTIPEPSTLIVWSLLGTFAVGLGWWRKRKAA
ncbi:MAG: PEP-CTERM sorting domain-containing protein [Thermoguttaceae bacterium]